MKKLYIAPSSKVFNVDLTSIIAASAIIINPGSGSAPGEADVKEDKDWNIWEE